MFDGVLSRWGLAALQIHSKTLICFNGKPTLYSTGKVAGCSVGVHLLFIRLVSFDIQLSDLGVQSQ